MKPSFLLSLCVCIASLSACKKDSENTPSKIDFLTSKNWRITAFTTSSTTIVTGNNPSTTSSTSDLYATWQACVKDNFYKFNTDKTRVFDEGATRCSSTAAQTSSIDWDINNDQTKLYISSGGISGVSSAAAFYIDELSASTMRLRQTASTTSGNTTTNIEYITTYTSF